MIIHFFLKNAFFPSAIAVANTILEKFPIAKKMKLNLCSTEFDLNECDGQRPWLRCFTLRSSDTLQSLKIESAKIKIVKKIP